MWITLAQALSFSRPLLCLFWHINWFVKSVPKKRLTLLSGEVLIRFHCSFYLLFKHWLFIFQFNMSVDYREAIINVYLTQAVQKWPQFISHTAGKSWGTIDWYCYHVMHMYCALHCSIQCTSSSKISLRMTACCVCRDIVGSTQCQYQFHNTMTS